MLISKNVVYSTSVYHEAVFKEQLENVKATQLLWIESELLKVEYTTLNICQHHCIVVGSSAPKYTGQTELSADLNKNS